MINGVHACSQSIRMNRWPPCLTVMGVIAVCLWAGWFSPAEVVGNSPEMLVRRLGDASFASREMAEQQLLELGYQSYSAIMAGTQSNDPEIRYRSLRLMKRLQRLAFADNQHQLRRNPWLVPESLAPGWDVFHQMLGDGEESRELYVQILNSETDLMLALTQPGWTLQFERRCADLQAFAHRRQSLELKPGSIAALLFLACHPDHQPSGSASSVVYMLTGDHQFRDAVENSQSRGVLRDLLGLWIRRSENSSPMQRLSDAAAFDLDAALDVARESISERHRAQTSAIQLENSIFYLARHGGDSVIEELEELLEDARELRGGSRGSELDVQVRDAALAALLYVTQQNPQTYGFYELRPKTGYLYIGSSARFSSVADRERALAKWWAWRAQHLRAPVVDGLDASEGELL